VSKVNDEDGFLLYSLIFPKLHDYESRHIREAVLSVRKLQKMFGTLMPLLAAYRTARSDLWTLKQRQLISED
jgi:hypothetical protein